MLGGGVIREGWRGKGGGIMKGILRIRAYVATKLFYLLQQTGPLVGVYNVSY